VSLNETTEIRQEGMLVNILEVNLQFGQLSLTPSPLRTFAQVKEDEERRSSAAEPIPAAELDPVSF
jgi:hypothetical protein